MKTDSTIKKLIYRLCGILPDSWYVKLKYRKNFGRWPNLKNPRTFNEKLNWLKLNDHNPLYTTMVDKYSAKEYVAGIIGKEYIIPTYGVWDKAEEIDFDSLPEKFVLKATHESGRVIICRDKSKLDKRYAIEEMKKSLRRNFYAVTREWPYKDVKPRIIAEMLLEAPDEMELADYKIHNFNGLPKVILVCRDRFSRTGLTEDFFDMDWKHLDVQRPGHPNAPIVEPMPSELTKMLELSKMLSRDIPFMRTDFYCINDKIYFGEITLYPASASVPFIPQDFDNILGENLDVENLYGGGKLLISNDLYVLLNVKHIDVSEKSINDYKFFCFNGKVKFMKVDLDRATNHRANYYDRDFDLIDIGEESYPPDTSRIINKPKNFNLMIKLAETIAGQLKFVRVDFYEVEGKVYFGEITFYPSSGAGRFTNESMDYKIGELLKL